MQQPTRRDFLATFAAAAIPAGDWKAHGFSSARRDELHGFLSAAAEAQEVAGAALAILHEGEVIFRESYGYADLKTRESFRTDRINHLASVSKTITSTLAVILDEKGVLSLDAPIEKYLPAFADTKVQGGPMTSKLLVWHGLAHRSGFPGNDAREDASAIMNLPVAEYIEQKRREGLVSQPGERYAYGSLGYMMVQAAMEQATGKPFEALIREQLLEPLGMKRTTLRPSDQDLSENPARYQRKDGALMAARSFPPGYGQSLRLLNSAGGFFSNLDEMSRFVAFHLAGGQLESKRLASADALSRMRRPHPADPGKFIPYGLGLNLQPGRIGEARHLGASGAMMWLDTTRKTGGVLLTQTRWEGNRGFQDAFEAKIKGIFAG